MKLKLPERRRFIRIETPLKLTVTTAEGADEVVTKNVSPVGLRFEIGKKLKETAKLDLSLHLPISDKPIRLVGKIIWQEKTSLEDNAPYDVGVEITEVEDRQKNTFLKYLCDLLYNAAYQFRT